MFVVLPTELEVIMCDASFFSIVEFCARTNRPPPRVSDGRTMHAPGTACVLPRARARARARARSARAQTRQQGAPAVTEYRIQNTVNYKYNW